MPALSLDGAREVAKQLGASNDQLEDFAKILVGAVQKEMGPDPAATAAAPAKTTIGTTNPTSKDRMTKVEDAMADLAQMVKTLTDTQGPREAAEGVAGRAEGLPEPGHLHELPRRLRQLALQDPWVSGPGAVDPGNFGSD